MASHQNNMPSGSNYPQIYSNIQPSSMLMIPHGSASNIQPSQSQPQFAIPANPTQMVTQSQPPFTIPANTAQMARQQTYFAGPTMHAASGNIQAAGIGLQQNFYPGGYMYAGGPSIMPPPQLKHQSEQSEQQIPMVVNTQVNKMIPSEFIKVTSMYHGQDFVKIIVGAAAQIYNLPKELASYQSRKFHTEFNGPDLESPVTTYNLPDYLPATFEMVVQYMYLGTVSFGREVKVGMTNEEGAAELTRGVEFFLLAQELDLLGPFDGLIDELRAILIVTQNNSLIPSHIQETFTKLPREHPLRILFSNACVDAWHHFTKPEYKGLHLWNLEGLLTSESFGSDLLKAIGERRANADIHTSEVLALEGPILGESLDG